METQQVGEVVAGTRNRLVARPNPGKRTWRTLWLKRTGGITLYELLVKFAYTGVEPIAVNWEEGYVLLADEREGEVEEVPFLG